MSTSTVPAKRGGGACSNSRATDARMRLFRPPSLRRNLAFTKLRLVSPGTWSREQWVIDPSSSVTNKSSLQRIGISLLSPASLEYSPFTGPLQVYSDETPFGQTSFGFSRVASLVVLVATRPSAGCCEPAPADARISRDLFERASTTSPSAATSSRIDDDLLPSR